MFVPILTDVFNHWVTQGTIPDSVNKGVITLLMKGGRNVWEVLEELTDGTEAALLNLYQSKALDRVDHRFFATVLETVKFQPEFCKWISVMYHNP